MTSRSLQLNALLDIEPARARRRILSALRRSKCGLKETADRLSISKPSLWRMLHRAELRPWYLKLRETMIAPTTREWHRLKKEAGSEEAFNQFVVAAIRDAGGRVKKAAKTLKVNFFTLYRHINSTAFNAHRAVLVAEFTHLYQLAEEDRKNKRAKAS